VRSKSQASTGFRGGKGKEVILRSPFSRKKNKKKKKGHLTDTQIGRGEGSSLEGRIGDMHTSVSWGGGGKRFFFDLSQQQKKNKTKAASRSSSGGREVRNAKRKKKKEKPK